jgi:hypothetical protein
MNENREAVKAGVITALAAAEKAVNERRIGE